MAMKTEPQKEHAWLLKLCGDWTSKGEMTMQPGQPGETWETNEQVRSLGDVWVQCEGKGEMKDGSVATTIMTLGYDTQTKEFVGNFVASMMTHMWIYEGALDADEKVLTLNTEGPDFSAPGKYAKYKDVIAIESDDHRTLTSYMQNDDGQWHQVVRADYWRKK
jgi:Protein of unknown function (DUF1579)